MCCVYTDPFCAWSINHTGRELSSWEIILKNINESFCRGTIGDITASYGWLGVYHCGHYYWNNFNCNYYCQISEDNFHHRVACMDRFISHRNLPNSFSVQCGKLESFIAREWMHVPIKNEILELVQLWRYQITPLSNVFAYDSCTAPSHLCRGHRTSS